MSGHSSLHGERFSVNVRMRRGTRRAVDEMAVLLGGLSRDDTVQLLLSDGLAAAYSRMGIKRDPVATADELLRIIAGVWEADLSAEELAAISTARSALARLRQFRQREAEQP